MSDSLHAAITPVGEMLQADGAWGVLTRDIEVRLLNASGSGCLIESRHPLANGTTGSLKLRLDGTEYTDAVRVTRCQAVQGAGAMFRIGVEFLWVSAPGERALRRVGRKLQQLAAREVVHVGFELRRLT